MFASRFICWFFRPAEQAVHDDRPPVEALVLPAPPAAPASSAPCPAAATPAVEVAINQTPNDLVICLKGEANFDAADALAGSLMAPATRRKACVNLDLTELKSISSLAMRVLVDYRRGVVRTGGRVRLAGALQPAVHEAFARAKLFELFDTIALGVAPGR